jgi:hypothetical protein
MDCMRGERPRDLASRGPWNNEETVVAAVMPATDAVVVPPAEADVVPSAEAAVEPAMEEAVVPATEAVLAVRYSKRKIHMLEK